MPFANNAGVRIYYEVEGQGPPIVLMHGHGMGVAVFRACGYVEGLASDYRLIMVDLRGHGKSDKLYDPDAYAADVMAGDVLTILNDLGLERAHYFGHSGGAAVGYVLGAKAHQRFQSMVLGDFSPYLREKELRIIRQMKVITSAGIGRLVAGIEAAETLPPAVKAHMFTNDPAALMACSEAGARWPQFDSLFPAIRVPCLMFAGEADPHYDGVAEGARLIPGSTFISIPGVGHLGSFLRSELIIPHVRSFLATITGDQSRANLVAPRDSDGPR